MSINQNRYQNENKNKMHFRDKPITLRYKNRANNNETTNVFENQSELRIKMKRSEIDFMTMYTSYILFIPNRQASSATMCCCY
jgi:hypothetical protein